MPATATLSTPFPIGFGSLMAQALRDMGKPEFYESMVELVRQMIPCDFWIIARYDARSKPLIISENGMNVNAKTLYSNRLWQRDPLPQHAGRRDTRAISLRELRRDGALDTVYARYLDRTLGIQDELALLFPISGGSFLALCLDRQRDAFTDQELALARELQTILVEMHHQHIFRAIDRQVSLFLHDSGVGKPEIMILSANNTVLYKSDTWSHAATQAFERDPLPSEIGCGDIAATGGRDGWSLTRMRDGSRDAILAGADVYLLRRNAADVGDRVAEFGRLHQLTERQQQILVLSLQGHPNASIAEKLRITVGGVKNHKLRLYEKLDITSERELMSAILCHL
ncbi:helix-turn-helix domain-containing protein [Rhizobium daejeonense]|nr:helix-turn-helix transcriptional regulator [Rhizobium daejeonense]